MKPEDCKQVFAMLSEYLDAELPADACEHLEEHLAGCPPCIEFLESLKRTIALCRGHGARETPPPLAESARQELLSSYQKMLAARKPR